MLHQIMHCFSPDECFLPRLGFYDVYPIWVARLTSIFTEAYLTFDTFELLLRDSGDHQILRPPQRADASRLFRHSRVEFELIGVYPRIGGVSGTESINCVILLLKVSMLCMALVSAGMQFHILGPLTPNEFSYKVSLANAQSLRRGGTFAVRPTRG